MDPGGSEREGFWAKSGSERRTILNKIDRKNTGWTASEERVNVDRRWLGTSVVRVRILAAGLVMLGAGCAVLGWGSRSRQTAANAAAHLSEIEMAASESQAAPIPGLISN